METLEAKTLAISGLEQFTKNMPKRFRSLNAALRYLNPTGTAGDDFNGEAPVGSQLRSYQDWRSGKKNVEYGPKAAGSKAGKLNLVEIQPFALPATDTERAIVEFSQRAGNNIGPTGIAIADLGHLVSPLDGATATRGFDPAQAIIMVNTSGTETMETSKLTGRKYKKIGSPSSATYPMGQTAANKTYKEAKIAIAQKVKTGIPAGTRRSVSFQPEVYR